MTRCFKRLASFICLLIFCLYSVLLVHYLFYRPVQKKLWVPVAALIIGSVISLYYYLKLVAIMFEQPSAEPVGKRYEFTSFIHQAGLLMLLLTTSVSILLGVYPSLLLYWLNFWFT